MATVVTFGEIMGRMSTEGHYTLRQSLPGNLAFCFAGAEANVAASIALLGGSSRFITALPRNDISDACIGNLRNLGIDTSHILLKDEGRLGIYFVQTGADQRPGKVIYDRDASAFSMTDGDEYDWDAVFSDASILHVTGITPAVSKRAAEAQLYCMRKAKEHGLRISFDCNFRSKLWNWEPGTPKERLAERVIGEMMEYVDILFAARIAPTRRAYTLSMDEWERLARAIPERIAFFTETNRISPEDYLRTKGKDYRNTPYIRIYGREGEPCPECGALLRRTVIAGRGSTYCPSCQGAEDAQRE